MLLVHVVTRCYPIVCFRFSFLYVVCIVRADCNSTSSMSFSFPRFRWLRISCTISLLWWVKFLVFDNSWLWQGTDLWFHGICALYSHSWPLSISSAVWEYCLVVSWLKFRHSTCNGRSSCCCLALHTTLSLLCSLLCDRDPPSHKLHRLHKFPGTLHTVAIIYYFYIAYSSFWYFPSFTTWWPSLLGSVETLVPSSSAAQPVCSNQSKCRNIHCRKVIINTIIILYSQRGAW